MGKAAQRFLAEAYDEYVEVKNLRRTKPIGKITIQKRKINRCEGVAPRPAYPQFCSRRCGFP